MVCVLIAAASPTVRAGLAALLRESAPALTVATAAGTGDDTALAEAVGAAAPDVVLVERLPVLPPDAAGPALVLLADDVDAAALRRALGAGVRAVLPRAAPVEAIVAAIEAAAAGLVALPPDVALPLLDELAEAPAPPAAARPALTPREQAILSLMAEGLGNKAIARRLGVAEATVKTHVAAVLAKLGAATRTEAVVLGARAGLVML